MSIHTSILDDDEDDVYKFKFHTAWDKPEVIILGNINYEKARTRYSMYLRVMHNAIMATSLMSFTVSRIR